MTPTITAFERSPDRGRGLARDMRVRWALEEVGQPYDVRLVSFSEMKEPAHLALHPFGQIPTYEEGDLALFESGAIILHIAERHAGLLPDDANARARAIAWMFAALNTVEPPIVEREMATLVERDKTWYEERLPMLEDRVRDRLGELSGRLGDADWLDGAFSAGDLLMVTVLRRLERIGHAGGLSEPRRLCRPRRSAARLPARLRRSAGGFHRQATDRLKTNHSGPGGPASSRRRGHGAGRRERVHGYLGWGRLEREVGFRPHAEAGPVGHLHPAVHRHRLVEQQRVEHRHHHVGAGRHHQELGERAVMPGDHEMVAVDARAVRDDEHVVRVGEGGDLEELGDAAAPADVGLDDVAAAHLEQHAGSPSGWPRARRW